MELGDECRESLFNFAHERTKGFFSDELPQDDQESENIILTDFLGICV